MTDSAATPPYLDALADELRRAAGVADPVPESWRAVASGSFAWAVIDAVPAQLSYDSLATRAGRIGGTSTGATPREVVYSAGSQAVELELDVGADKLRLLGQVVPSRRVDVVALWPEGRSETTSGDDGAFRFDELPRRPFCLHVLGDTPVKTGWVVT